MNPNIDPYTSFDSTDGSHLIQPLNVGEFTTNSINTLYRDEQLTQDEYLILDFIGVNGLVNSGFVIMSFQGIKRLISLHQARVTKALSRLINKDLIQKMSEGYALTESGSLLFNRLFKQFERSPQPKSEDMHTLFSDGYIQGPLLTKEQYQEVSEGLVGRWFGKFRFTSKIDYSQSFDICWISTDGSISAMLRIGPDNKLQLSMSGPSKMITSKEKHMLVEHVSQILEAIIDAPVLFIEQTQNEAIEPRIYLAG
ncbi:MAG: hypothetical protein ACXADH_16455 [Candidatus Kariarchaeaceae archaeon]